MGGGDWPAIDIAFLAKPPRTGERVNTHTHTVTITFKALVRATMESTHEHAMRLQASQQVAPLAIPPPPCRAHSDLDEMSHHDLTYPFFSFGGDVGHDYLIGDVMMIRSFMVL